MQYEYLVSLKKHPSWKLLAADSAPMILGFFHQVFIKKKQRTIPADEMISMMEDYLFHLHRILGEDVYQRSAKTYLDEWAGAQTGFLRKFYPARGEQAEYDLTPASEKVLEWISSFAPKEFIGTESRLLTVFRLLREIASHALIDPEAEIQRLDMIQVNETCLPGRSFPDRYSFFFNLADNFHDTFVFQPGLLIQELTQLFHNLSPGFIHPLSCIDQLKTDAPQLPAVFQVHDFRQGKNLVQQPFQFFLTCRRHDILPECTEAFPLIRPVDGILVSKNFI